MSGAARTQLFIAKTMDKSSIWDFQTRTFGLKEAGRSMGEVGATVKLTNSVDEALARRQQLARDQVRVYEADALIDTGAVRSAIPAQVAELLGLTVRGERVVEQPVKKMK